MWAGLAQVRAGARLGDVSHAIAGLGPGRPARWGIVEGYGGHGIGSAMHMDPHVLNYGQAGTGPVLTAGMALAIEPMFTAGRAGTRELNDGWTVVTADGSRAAHWEHTVAIYDDGPVGADRPRRWPGRTGARGVALSAAAGPTVSA